MKTFWTLPLFDRRIRRQARLNAKQGKPLDPTQDIIFKDLFSAKDDDSRKALCSLLSACIRRPVRDLQVRNSELLPEYYRGKIVLLDVFVTFNDGEQADLEIQATKGGDDLETRALVYAAKLLTGQIKRGLKYREVKRVYSIFFLDKELFPRSKKLPRRYFLMEESEHDRLSETLEVIFYEMPKLEAQVQAFFESKSESVLKSLSTDEKWCIFLRYKHEEKMAPLIQELCRQEEGIMYAEKKLKKMDRSYVQWSRSFSRLMGRIDYDSGLDAARQDGKAEGIIEGKAEAKAEAEAAAEQKLLNLINQGLSIEEIKNRLC
jgi:predicted transposase/invertase (TIGR01784 family)